MPLTTDVNPDAPKPGRRVIKRYSNRKLYDTKDSRYVTLLQIAEIVRGGEEVQIIDNKSKEDLTKVTLAQIILEEEKANKRPVPLQTLKDLIHQRTEKVLSDLRETPIGRLIPAAKRDEPAPESGEEESSSPLRIVEQWQQKIDERIRALLPSWSPWQQLEAEVKALHARIDELEKRLKSAQKTDGQGPE